ncbi:MAG: peptidase M22 [Ruminococcaceae bacterium]|nr:peptidase M22 [Oscillospiraceae bacterium]
MALVLGLDTSNYTTSCALYDSDTNTVIQRKQLLPVKEGECGIRQSDAVFHHTKQLPVLIEDLFSGVNNKKIDAVCASLTPRRQEGSYMPCFTVGFGVARCIASSMDIPLYDVSHQQGHIAAALYSSEKLNYINNPFLAFHVSGGTTEAIYVTPSEDDVISCEIVGKTLDLNAGQLIDRIGVMMGLQFPCGKELEKLALQYNGKIKVKPVLKGNDCCLSGFENKLSTLYRETGDKALVAATTLAYVETTISAMTEELLVSLGDVPVVYAGGVMSNAIIKNKLCSKFNAEFAQPEFSCDNAVGVAVLGAVKLTGLYF